MKQLVKTELPASLMVAEKRETPRRKSRLAASLLGVTLGPFGAHRFYLGYFRLGLAQLVLTCLTLGVAGVWGFAEGLLICFGAFARDAAGAKLAMGSHTVAVSLGASCIVHVGVAAGLYAVASSAPVLLAPTESGVQSINILASTASPLSRASSASSATEAAQPPAVELDLPPDSAPPSALKLDRTTAFAENAVQPVDANPVFVKREVERQRQNRTSELKEPAIEQSIAAVKIAPVTFGGGKPATESNAFDLKRSELTPEQAVADSLNVAVASQLTADSTSSAESRGAERTALPSKQFSPAPTYPEEELAKKITGRVVLKVSVASDGSVEDVEVHKTSGNAALDSAAQAAVLRWRFAPATRLGVNVAATIAVPIRFDIEP